MSSDPNTPDFDSMSPEEMMAWMESLAKRQGADASGFTTAADMDVAEVDPDSVDDEILNQKYIPDGWTEERWDAHLAKEEAEKQARLAEQAEAPPTPEPEPVAEVELEPEPTPEPVEAVGQAAGDDGTPDFDSMSPEEMMEWMESLAKRQGADASGFTTEAKMDVAEVDPNSVDESILNQKYVPGNMSEEAWDEYLEKEERKKAEQQATQATAPEPEPEPILDILEGDDDDEDEELGLPVLDVEGLEPESTSDDGNPMAWLENLASTDEESEELDLPDLSGLGDDLGGLSELASESEGDPMDWLASLAGDVDESPPELDLGDMSAGLEGLEAFALDADDEDDDDEDEALAEANLDDILVYEDDEDYTDADSENFLESLARLEGAPEDELATDANTPIPDFLNMDDEDDLALEDILEDTQPSEELEPAFDIDDPSSLDNPEAWLDALAANSNETPDPMSLFDDEEDDDDEELLVMMDDDDEDDDGQGTQVIDALNKGQDVSPEDIQGFFEGMFDRANSEFAHLDEDFDDEEVDDEDVGEAVAIDMPDWLQELSGGAPASDDDDEEEEGEDLMADVLAGIDEDIEEEEEEAALPDWLDEGSADDTGDVIADIIADEMDVPPGETAVIAMGSGKQIEVDPNDTWTQAFLMEDNEEEAEEWYTERLSQVDVDAVVAQAVAEEPADEPDMTTVQMTNPPGAIALEPATFPVEESLPEGEPEVAPEWLTGQAPSAPALMPDFSAITDDDEEDIEIPDWLESSIDEDDVEIPDWLSDESDDIDEAIPDWLADAGVEELEPAAIPDWLTDTMEDEPADLVAQVVESPPQPAAPAAPAIVQVQSPPPAADIAATIKSAQDKVANNDLDSALQDYESVVRANDGLDIVVTDLQKLTKNDTHKKNPAVYRVLGDAMMRKGDLQDALDVYRRALNLL